MELFAILGYSLYVARLLTFLASPLARCHDTLGATSTKLIELNLLQTKVNSVQQIVRSRTLWPMSINEERHRWLLCLNCRDQLSGCLSAQRHLTSGGFHWLFGVLLQGEVNEHFKLLRGCRLGAFLRLVRIERDVHAVKNHVAVIIRHRLIEEHHKRFDIRLLLIRLFR